MILVITEVATDGHLRPVLAELVARGHQVRIFDPGDLLTASSLTIRGSSAGQSTNLSWGQISLPLETVDSVWFRKPPKVALPDGLNASETAWFETETLHLKDGLWGALDAYWVSHPTAIRKAGRKIPQLATAARLGFNVPDYMVTNEPEMAQGFVADHPEGVITKVLGVPTIMNGDIGGMVYTHLLDDADRGQLDHVRHCPTLLQAFVAKRYDVRVTVFGDQLFAITIDGSAHPETRTDFRKARSYDMPHTVIELPPDLQQRCLDLVAALGLEYGAIDLLLTDDGEFIFLEINPNGQWFWLELATGAPMVKAMCDLLERGTGPGSPASVEAVGSVSTPHRPRHLWDLGEQTIRLDDAARRAYEADPVWTPAYASQVWVEEFDGPIKIHFGDFDAGDT